MQELPFAEDTIDAKGKVKKNYPQRLVMMPTCGGAADYRARRPGETKTRPTVIAIGERPARSRTAVRATWCR